MIVRPELKNNNIALRIDLCDGNDILVNPVEIQKVILNFLNNAIQAIVSIEGSNKTITISPTFYADILRLSIADNGVGILDNRQNNLFELFNSEKKGAMDFGLWLCKHIVTRHNGKLWYETSKEGGAIFVMELPAGV